MDLLCVLACHDLLQYLHERSCGRLIGKFTGEVLPQGVQMILPVGLTNVKTKVKRNVEKCIINKIKISVSVVINLVALEGLESQAASEQHNTKPDRCPAYGKQ